MSEAVLEAARPNVSKRETRREDRQAPELVLEPVLQVQLSAGYGKRSVVEDLQFTLHAGERLGLVGSSGAGKSTVLLALLGLLPWRGGWARGEVRLHGKNLLTLQERETRKIRGRSVALVPQSPLSALNGALSLQTHFQEAWRAHEAASPRELAARVHTLFEKVQLPTDAAFLKRKPGQISVGQAQRCALALALLHRPALLIADEPTSALDPATQVEVLSLLNEVSRADGTALLFVSHDLLSVLRLCDRVGVLHSGKIGECLAVEDLHRAQHPALLQLLRTLPVPPEVLLQHRLSKTLCNFATPQTKVMTPP